MLRLPWEVQYQSSRNEAGGGGEAGKDGQQISSWPQHPPKNVAFSLATQKVFPVGLMDPPHFREGEEGKRMCLLACLSPVLLDEVNSFSVPSYVAK